MAKFYTVILFVFLSTGIVFGQWPDVKFTHLTNSHGLSQSTVTCILKDRFGYMWFGTMDGLNKYDGYKFTVYRHDPEKPGSIPASDINTLYEDKAGDLWIGTNGGALSRYDRATDSFIHFKEDLTDNQAISDKAVNTILEDSKGNLWLGTYAGLNLFNRKTKKVTRFAANPKDTTTLTSPVVYALAEDKQGNLWVGTTNGLNCLNLKTQRITRYRHQGVPVKSISNKVIYEILPDEKGNLWVATSAGLAYINTRTRSVSYFQPDSRQPNSISSMAVHRVIKAGPNRLWVGTEQALDLFDIPTSQFKHYKKQLSGEAGLSNNSVISLLQDRQGILWVGTSSGGINKYDTNLPYFNAYQSHNPDLTSLSFNVVTAFAEDGAGDIWVGTDGGGLNIFKRATNNFYRFRPDSNNKASLVNSSILALVQSRKTHYLWIGTYNGGVDRYDWKTNTFAHYTTGTTNRHLNNNTVFAILEDQQGNIWMGTNGGGLNVLDVKTQIVTKYQHQSGNPNSLSNDFIRSLYEDRAGNIWAGTYSGYLNKFDPLTRKFTRYDQENSNLSNDVIISIFEDQPGNLWVGTMGGGLNLLNKKTNRFTAFTERHGLPNNVINSIVEDAAGYLWLSTNNGISRFNPRAGVFKNYSPYNGLQSMEFSPGAAFCNRTGEVFFGGVNGFNVINPAEIPNNRNVPPVVFTGFQLFNRPVRSGTKGSPLQQHISETKILTLAYDQAVFTLEFAALDYTIPEQNEYAYQLDGFDKHWNYVGKQRRATYTNLDPGQYTFRVKASNNDGVWSQRETTLTIIISPPFWMTWWFRLLLGLALFAAILSFYRFRLRAIHTQKAELEKQVHLRTAEVLRQKQELESRAVDLILLNQHLEEQKAYEQQTREEAEQARLEAERANQAKSIFLATMSHEIRTPLNGVIGMTSLLAETNLDPEQRNFTEIIRSSGKSLLTVINDILDFSKIESGKMELDQQVFDLRTCIEEVLDMFSAKAAQQKLDLLYQLNHDIPLRIIGDSTRLKQILINLIGNAFKFTSRGEIVVGVKKLGIRENGQLELAFNVRDTGIGFAIEKGEYLFKAFSQLDSSTTRKYGGTGLGLAICKRLVGLMGGTIAAESRPGIGTTFRFTILTQESGESDQSYVHCTPDELADRRILVVDDNGTNRRILERQLTYWKYTAVLAPSGAEALELLRAHSFDLVITDMHMPGMDGVELAQAIRQEQQGMPLLLLSSIGHDVESKCKGLFRSILTKPVKQWQLQQEIVNCLKQAPPTVAPEPEEKKLCGSFADQHPLRILVAEDYPVNQMFAQMVLERLGYDAELAENGRQAVEAWQTTRYDVILMDVQMPEMDGLEATYTIREQGGEQPYILAVTASAMKEDEQACLQAGMNDYISKPIDLDDLMKALEKAAAVLRKKALVIE